MTAMLHLAGRRQRIPRVIRERANDLDFMNDDQLVDIYRLNRQSIVEVCEEVEVGPNGAKDTQEYGIASVIAGRCIKRRA